jgi:hypothetical protein
MRAWQAAGYIVLAALYFVIVLWLDRLAWTGAL